MAEALGLVASIFAVIQLADRIVTACKYYIDTVEDYPKDLRLVYVEIGLLKLVFEGLSLLDQGDPAELNFLETLHQDDGPIQRCKEVMQELEKLFPPTPDGSPATGIEGRDGRPSKRQRIQATLTNLAWPLKASTCNRFLQEILQHKSTISLALQGQLLFDVRQVQGQVDRILVTIKESEKREFVSWVQGSTLQGTDPWTLHKAARKLYEEGTANWVFQTPQWASWRGLKNRGIWLHGIPGSGKTVLAAHVIEQINKDVSGKEGHISIYYYCYHGHNQDETEPFLRHIVSQLLAAKKHKEVPQSAWDSYQQHAVLDTMLLLGILEQITPLFKRVYISVDALDESRDRENLLRVLAQLTTEARFSNLQVFTTSRRYQDIRTYMTSMSTPISMSNPHVERDIKQYVSAQLGNNPRFKKWPRDLRREVESALSSGAQGMFRWAACQLDLLRRMHTPSQIRQVLKELPETLDETYQRIFSQIPPEERGLLKHVLHWLAFHNHIFDGLLSMTSQLLLDSYTIMEPDSQDDHLLCDVDTLKDLCGCLVTFSIDKEDNETATIAHYTVREYLEARRMAIDPSLSWFKLDLDTCYSRILDAIFHHAISVNLEPEGSTSDTPMLGSEPLHDITDYCILASVRSIQICEKSVDSALVFRLLDPSKPHYNYLQNILMVKTDSRLLRGPLFSSVPFFSLFWDKTSLGIPGCRLAVLIHLILTQSFYLAEEFLVRHDERETVCATVSGSFSRAEYVDDASGSSTVTTRKYRLHGELIDVLAQIGFLYAGVLKFLGKLNTGLGLKRTRELLLLHYISMNLDLTGPIMTLLLETGAVLEPETCPVTPLQVAICRGDLISAERLLRAGADPNHSGYPKPEEDWNDSDEILFRAWSEEVSGLTPLDILRLGRHRFDGPLDEDRRAELTVQFRDLLLKYGAKPVSEDGVAG